MKTYLTAVGFGGGVFSQPRCNEIFDGKIERVKNDVLYPHGNHRALPVVIRDALSARLPVLFQCSV